MKGLLKVILILSVFLVAPSCGSSKKTKKAKKRIIMVDTPRYGKNKLYFSKKYQSQLKSRAKKNQRQNKRR
jgi:hypothetical protein